MAMMFTLFACGGSTTGTSSGSPSTAASPSSKPSTAASPAASASTAASPAASASKPAASASASAGAKLPAAPKVLNIGVSGGLGRFLAGLSPNESLMGCDAVFDTVFWFDPVTKKVASNILASWEWEDPTTFVAHMKKDVTFSNGDNATAEDLVFSYLSHIERGSNYVNDANLIQDQCVARDKYTAVFKLKMPYNAFPYLRVYLLDKAWSRSLKDSWADQAWFKPVGSGPYSVEEWVNDSHMLLKSRGDKYWYKDQGPIVIDTINIKNYPDVGTLYMGLETGEVDVVGAVSSTDYGNFLKSGTKGVDITTSNTGAVAFFCFGYKTTEKFKDVRVRQALAIGIKWDEVGKAGYGPFYQAPKSIASKISPDYVEVGAYQYDPVKAKQLLTDAGYGPSKPLTLATTEMQTPLYQDQFQVFQFYADQLGIKATCQFADASTTIGKWISPDGGCEYAFWSSVFGAPGGILTSTLGWIDTKTGVYFLLMEDPTFLDLYGKIKSSTDPKVASQATKDLQKYAHDGYWRIPISEETIAIGYRTEKLAKSQIDAVILAANYLHISQLALQNSWK